MGKIQKKNGKGRLDRYYFLAKEKGYRARSSFKILQINEKYGHFLEKSKVVIDLCCAPGSWCQVASQLCPVNSLIIGVDIVPVKSLPNCITFQSDITTEDCRSRLRGHMKTWKADTVLHDGAPNVGMGWVQDAFTQSQLTLQALKLAVENLTPGGTFVTKVFRSKDYNNLMWVFQQLFEKVEATKPPASRNVSAEIFVVCKGFKAPKKMDPRLLDPKEVFEELPDGPVNNEAKVFNPEKKRRSRQGYDEGDYIQYKTMDLLEFIKDEEPINNLGGLNEFTYDPEDMTYKMLKKLKHHTPELLECFKDLKVLGKKDFKHILKFRKNARDLLGYDDEEKPEIEVIPLTEEEQIEKELEQLQKKRQQKQKREKRTKNETKQKEIQRMQMNMLTDMNIGLDAAMLGADSLFNLTTAEKTGQLADLAKGKRRMIFSNEEKMKDNDIAFDDEEANTGDEIDALETQMDDMYHGHTERKAERDAKYKAMKARGGDDDAWDGIEDKSDSDLESDRKDYEELSDSDLDSDDDAAIDALIAKQKEELAKEAMSKQAKVFFADSIFGDVGDDVLLASSGAPTKGSSPKGAAPKGAASKSKAAKAKAAEHEDSDSEMDADSESDFEIVAPESEFQSDDDSDYDSDTEKKKTRTHSRDVDLATVEAMTLAHQVALGQKNKHDLIEEGINRYSFRDSDNLPDWFNDDEKRHNKIIKPITKEAATAIKEKLRQMNARPIKKVMEAQGRKKLRAMRRIEKMRKKSDTINDDGAKSERDKAEEISKLMRKMTKKQAVKPKTTYVVAKGSNRGLAGRPRGVKGKYRMVDGTMKNEARALKRIAKKNKK
ncbi:hypothetical protein BABINDRAFT_7719 [Babjeviella inositovora NRRL Y-12698]|uniref:Uncharacterized protein n=1 Tax=Babjeviella inositovora NRRL Y-12698 TaxID=984486 RepID=A0A1E3QRH9_9ASCO|nr:uncharacterized protein BABINDRAFT_7719 [Babjeviella inositovora NRRL Y-12698]ODQ80260.1 hypothetical protein BABINDRAFT_7719 [Babjeviella inositovora NRRL Y-12698]